MAESWRRWIPVGRKSVSRDVDDELRFHIEERTRDLIAEGRTPEEARREAERRFGEVTAIREHLVADDTRQEFVRGRLIDPEIGILRSLAPERPAG